MISKLDTSTNPPVVQGKKDKKDKPINVIVPKLEETQKNDLKDKNITQKNSGDTLSESFFRAVTDKDDYILHAPNAESYIKKEAIDSITRNVSEFVDIIINKTIKEIGGIVNVYKSDIDRPTSEEKLLKHKKNYEITNNDIRRSEDVIKKNILVMKGCIERFKRECNLIEQFHKSCDDRIGKAYNDLTYIKKLCSQNYIPNDFERLSEMEKKVYETEKTKYFIEKEFAKAPYEADNILMLSDRITVFRSRIYHHYYEIYSLPNEAYANKIHQFYYNILEQYKKDYDRELPLILERQKILKESVKLFEVDIKLQEDKNTELKGWLDSAEKLIKDREDRIPKDKQSVERTSNNSGWLSGILGGTKDQVGVSSSVKGSVETKEVNELQTIIK